MLMVCDIRVDDVPLIVFPFLRTGLYASSGHVQCKALVLALEQINKLTAWFSDPIVN
jgi:hypothetical protein